MNEKLKSLSDKIADKAEYDFLCQLERDISDLRKRYSNYGSVKTELGVYNGPQYVSKAVAEINVDQVFEFYKLIVKSKRLIEIKQKAIDDFIAKIEELEGMIHE